MYKLKLIRWGSKHRWSVCQPPVIGTTCLGCCLCVCSYSCCHLLFPFTSLDLFACLGVQFSLWMSMDGWIAIANRNLFFLLFLVNGRAGIKRQSTIRVLLCVISRSLSSIFSITSSLYYRYEFLYYAVIEDHHHFVSEASSEEDTIGAALNPPSIPLPLPLSLLNSGQ